MVALAHGADPQHALRKQLKPQVSMLQANSTKKIGKVAAQKIIHSLRKARGDDDMDDDDDDEEDAADDAALKTARQTKQYAKSDLKNFKDDEAFDTKISAEVRLMTNETESPTLSSFLGALRTEMRNYNKPTYPKYLEDKLAAADQKVADLEKELGVENKKDEEDAAADKKAEDTRRRRRKEEKKEKEDKKDDDAEDDKNVKAVADLAKDAEGTESNADAVKEVERNAGQTWAISFFANIALLAAVFAMASAANTKVRKFTWMMIDQVIAVFLAVMYFQAFDSLLDFNALPLHYHLLSTVLHAVAMLGMVLFLAYKLKGDGTGIAIVCGAGAHIVSFSSIHAGASVQNGVWVNYSMSWMMMIFGLGVLGLGLLIVGYLVWTAKKRADVLDNDAFMDKTDDLENDFGAMAFSVVFTMMIRFLITGHHPVDDDSGFTHTQAHRNGMFVYACVALIVAGFATTFCTKKAAEAEEAKNYAKKRIFVFLGSVSAMNVAWAFLYWGEWEFFEALFPGQAIKGRVMFAITTTIVGGLAIIGLTKLTRLPGKTGKSAERVAVTAVSLLVAWSWELCFDAAVEDMTEGVSHPAGWKIATTLTLFAIIIPVYAFYVKPACARNGADD